MKEQEAKQIVSQLLEQSNRSEIVIKSISIPTDKIISAIVSYVWYLNGHRKEVKQTSATAYKDESQNWKLLGI